MPHHSSGPVPVCIPARWGASRWPGKLSLPYGDDTVLGRAVRVAQAAELGPVYVLADDPRLLELVPALPGVSAVLWDLPVRNGSERVAAALRAGRLGEPTFVLNLQADAVGAEPMVLRHALEALIADPAATLGTVAVPCARSARAGRTTVVAARGRALYFSRAALPADRDAGGAALLAHIGVYAYRALDLLRVASMSAGPLEQAEQLEQLRWLEQGEIVALRIVEGPASLSAAVDWPGDLDSEAGRG